MVFLKFWKPFQIMKWEPILKTVGLPGPLRYLFYKTLKALNSNSLLRFNIIYLIICFTKYFCTFSRFFQFMNGWPKFLGGIDSLTLRRLGFLKIVFLIARGSVLGLILLHYLISVMRFNFKNFKSSNSMSLVKLSVYFEWFTNTFVRFPEFFQFIPADLNFLCGINSVIWLRYLVLNGFHF